MNRRNEREVRREEGFSRRDFLRGASVAAGGLLVAEPPSAPAVPPPEVVGPGEVPVSLRVNSKVHKLNLEPRVTLLDALRDRLDLTGAKRVCDRGTCGSCTVIMDGKPIYACNTLAIEAEGHEITTIEGLSKGDSLHPVMTAFVDNDAQQCGFCTPGFVVAVKAYIDKHPNPTMQEIETGLGGNLCRCGTYAGVRQAVLEAAKAMKGGRG